MAKLVISNIDADYGATASINTAFDDIETAFENTLSRDGTAPNAMSVEIDMGSNPINNLSAPTNNNSAARLQDIVDLLTAGGSATAVSTTVSDTLEYYEGTNVESVLQEIGAVTIDSISKLRLQDKGNRAYIKGYYDEGDGGGGGFYWDSTSTDVDNGGTIIKATAVTIGRWIRLYSDAVNVRWFGAKGDGTTDDRAALFAADAVGSTLHPSGTYRISSNITYSNLTTFDDNAKLSIDSAKIVTFDMTPIASYEVQIFSGAGAVSGLSLCSIGWWGGVADGTTDDSTAFNNSIASLSSGGELLLLAGDHSLSSTALVDKSDITVRGSGQNISRLVGFEALSPILQVGSSTVNVARINLRDFGVTRNLNGASKIGTIGFHYVRSFHSDICSFENLIFNGSSSNVKAGDGTDRPQAFTLWKACDFGNYDQVDDVAFEVLDGIEQKFIGCRFQGFDTSGFQVTTGGNPNDWVFESCYMGSVSYSFGGTGADYSVEIRSGFGFFFNNCIFEEGQEANVQIAAGKLMHFNNCLCGGAGHTGYGYRIVASSADVTGVSITGGEIRDFGQTNSAHPGTGRGVYYDNSTNSVAKVTISGVTIRNNTTSATIRSDAEYTIISGCTIWCTAADTLAILLTSNANYSAINGNSIDCSLNTTENSINLVSGTLKCAVVGNAINAGAATAIVDSGTSNIVASNAV